MRSLSSIPFVLGAALLLPLGVSFAADRTARGPAHAAVAYGDDSDSDRDDSDSDSDSDRRSWRGWGSRGDDSDSDSDSDRRGRRGWRGR